jgi:hypothetical protein
MLGLLGAVGALVAVEILDRVAGRLEPGQSAVVAEVQEKRCELTDSRLGAAGGTVYRRAASVAVDDQLRRDIGEIGSRIARLGAEHERARAEVSGKVHARIGAAKAELPKARDRAGE